MTPELIAPGGHLMVGVDPYRGEVVINLDQDRTGYLTFTPQQARHLARLLEQKAAEIERECEAGGFGISLT